MTNREADKGQPCSTPLVAKNASLNPDSTLAKTLNCLSTMNVVGNPLIENLESTLLSSS